ncbi:hypothetical protein [Mesorhizobium sp. WSM3860]|uniref:hypothetical protein n=1 Tax=Mesorhizobium sp. WSM3860 TaxID=2029403 RepID=UPI001140E725|nr:hypothetical protein [Mesorhizobium sp. WSM3860]
MKIFIHGGMHKTATKSLQSLLYQKRALLIERGIYYPDIGAPHHHSLLSTKRKGWSPEVCTNEIRNAEDAGAHSLILSAEGVSILSAGQFRQLSNTFRGHDLTYIFCLRHWAGYMPSRWSQYCRRRDTQTFADYVAAASNPTLRHVDLHFDDVLGNAITSADCGLKVVSYNNALATDGVLAALLSAFDFDDSLVSALNDEETWTNARDAWRTVEISRLLNGVLASRRGLRQNELFLAVGERRACSEFFDLSSRFAMVDAQLMSDLGDMLEDRAEVIRLPGTVGSDVESSLNSKYLRHVTNPIDGKLFATPGWSEVTATDITWEEFEGKSQTIMNRALSEIGLS